MYKLTVALAAFAFVAAAGGARADSSGHVDINSLIAQMPRSYDALSPVGYDVSYSSGPTACSLGRGGLKFGCTVSQWRQR
jgi:hypothetical protein